MRVKKGFSGIKSQGIVVSFISDYHYGLRKGRMHELVVHWLLNFLGGGFIGFLAVGLPAEILRLLPGFPDVLVIVAASISGIATFVYFVESQAVDKTSGDGSEDWMTKRGCSLVN